MEYRDYQCLVQQKYLEFFSNKNAAYMHFDGVHQPHYIGIAYEFVCDISSGKLLVDYDDLYNNVFKDNPKWLYVDSLQELTDDFIGTLTKTQVVTIFAAIRHKELFCTGFIESCGKTGTIIRLLNQLKLALEREDV